MEYTINELNQKLEQGIHVLPPSGTKFECDGIECELASYQVHFGRVNAEVEGLDMLQAVDVHGITRILKLPKKEITWDKHNKGSKTYLLAKPR